MATTKVHNALKILETAGYEPSIISGAGLVNIIEQGKIGNAKVGRGEWLIIEADESDGSIVKYHPEIGLLLNIDKDHQEITTTTYQFDEVRRKGSMAAGRGTGAGAAHGLTGSSSRTAITPRARNSGRIIN